MLRKILSLVLPALFPSWRFFRDVGPAPQIEYRTFYPGVSPDWHNARVLPPRVSLATLMGRLVWNVDWNEGLYLVSCAERLGADPANPLLGEVERRLARSITAPGDTQLQIRIAFTFEEDGRLVKYVDFESQPRSLRDIRA